MSQSCNKASSEAETSPDGESAAVKEDTTIPENTEDTKAENEKEDDKENTDNQENGEQNEKELEEKEAEEDEKDKDQGTKEEPEPEREAIEIDLSRMKTLYQFRNRPTLPYLLTEYGMEDKGAPPVRRKEKEKKKKKRMSFGDDSGRDREKEKQIEERQLQVLEDMNKLRDYYYDEYSSLLQNKVDQQRHEIRQNTRMMQNKIAQQEETARQESHRVKRRLERNAFVSNSDFLEDLPKSDLFYITQLKDKLIKEGTLKSQTDFDIFWQRIQQPEIFYMYFKVPKSDDPMYRDDFNENASSRAASTWKCSGSTVHQLDHSPAPLRSLPDAGPRALSRIAEARESSRPGTRLGQHWAITQQFPAQQREPREKRRSSFTGLKQHVPHLKSTYLQDLEKRFPKRRFPKLEMPKLHCFTMNLGPNAPDPDEVRHQVSLRELEKNRKKYTYKLNKMHQLAMTNAAAASRILEMHEDMDFIINGAPLKDLISDQHFYSGLPAPQQAAEAPGPASSSPLRRLLDPSEQYYALPSVLEQEEREVSTIPSHRSSKKTGRSSKSRSSKKSTTSKRDGETPVKVEPIPLCLSEVVDNTHIVPIPLSLLEVVDNTRIIEAKCLSTLWTNYMKETPAIET
ncbi:hypothetical protein ACOMHN_019121 [Nucella lapillus]